jgi:hypothetical protein
VLAAAATTPAARHVARADVVPEFVPVEEVIHVVVLVVAVELEADAVAEPKREEHAHAVDRFGRPRQDGEEFLLRTARVQPSFLLELLLPARPAHVPAQAFVPCVRIDRVDRRERVKRALEAVQLGAGCVVARRHLREQLGQQLFGGHRVAS